MQRKDAFTAFNPQGTEFPDNLCTSVHKITMVHLLDLLNLLHVLWSHSNLELPFFFMLNFFHVIIQFTWTLNSIILHLIYTFASEYQQICLCLVCNIWIVNFFGGEYRDGTSIILSDDVGQLYILSTGQGESQKDAMYDQVLENYK